MRVFTGSIACLALALALGCASSSSGSAADASTEGGGGPTFTQIYTTIIQTNCTPCHAQGIGLTTGKLDMSSQATAYTNLVGVAAAGGSCTGKGTRVTPKDTKNSLMFLKIDLADPVPCGEKMPLTLPPLSKDQVALIEAWINGGALNN